MERDPSGCEGMEESREFDGGQKDMEVERESPEVMCNTGIPIQSGDRHPDRTATTEAAGLRKQLGQEDCRRVEGG